MITFEINDMTCGHCVGAITKAVALVDPGATVKADLASHCVQIESTASTADALCNAIEVAGFTPVAVASDATATVESAPRKGCCCG